MIEKTLSIIKPDAVERNLENKIKDFFEDKNIRGASTITQQLIKNTLLTPERTYTRKLKELILSTKLENDVTYLNGALYLNKKKWGVFGG